MVRWICTIYIGLYKFHMEWVENGFHVSIHHRIGATEKRWNQVDVLKGHDAADMVVRCNDYAISHGAHGHIKVRVADDPSINK